MSASGTLTEMDGVAETGRASPRRLVTQPLPPQRRGRVAGLGYIKRPEASRAPVGGGGMSQADPRHAEGTAPDVDTGRAMVASAYQRFEPGAYLRNNYAPPRGDLSSPDGVGPWKLGCLAKTFATGEVAGRTLIDIGSGPTIYQLLSACAYFEDITMTDFLEVNRQELGLWLHEEPGAFDWSMYSQHVCLIEGRGESWQEKERQLRARVKRVLPIDVHQPQPLGISSLAPLPADALISAFCLEAVSPDLTSFQRALDHITTLLKPGGHLLLIGGLEESWYHAGAVRLTVVPVGEETVREALLQSGYEIRDLRTYVMPAYLQTGVDDVKGIFFAWAQKKMRVGA